jgi:AcrR family transcriptional regulator
VFIYYLTVSQSQPKRRARSAQAKDARRDQILAAAEALLGDRDLDAVAMADVATQAALAKGTLYLYFKTKEGLFLALLERALDGWFDALDAALAGDREWLPAAATADLITGSLADRPLLRRLLARQAAVLEPNVEAEPALRFKWRVAGRIATTGTLLERRSVYLRPGDGGRLILHLQALAMGIESLAAPTPTVAAVLEAPGLESLRLEFEAEFRAAAGALLVGLERTN